MAKSNQAADVLAALQDEAEKHPELADTVDLHCRLLEAKVAATAASHTPVPAAIEAEVLVEQGQPLLRISDLELDWDALSRLFDQVCRITAQGRPDLADALASIRDLPHEAPEAFRAVVSGYLATGEVEEAEATSVNGELLSFVLNQALHPFLQADAAGLAPLVDDTQWYRSYCPVCGGRPDMAALEKDVAGRWLLCSRCDTEWIFRRVECPYCGNDDHRKLAYHPSPDGSCRLYVCEACKGYLKTVDRRERWQHRPLPVERVLTVGMDVAAVEAGYGERRT